MDQADIYYEAMKTRDHRFDGKFFVGVKTTGIYCRPICPAKPKRENVEFFKNHVEAERAGYRPCLRCRPESAPQSPVWIGKSAIVQRAVKVLNQQQIIEFNEEEFADLFGVSARHLRRLFIDEIGKTPKQLSFENRLNLARKLIIETNLSISEIVFASGFQSIRRFNDAFKERFKKKPTEIRRQPLSKSETLKISLPYRPPFDFNGLLHFYRAHQVGRLEWFEGATYFRILAFGPKRGVLSVTNDELNSRLIVGVDFPDTSMIHSIISRVRAMFDLDCDPLVIANSLESDPSIRKILKKHQGIRMPSGWDAFETAISAILGQLVSVERGRALVGDLIELLEADSGLFPSAEKIAFGDLSSLKTTGARKKTLREFSKAIVEKRISLEPTQDVNDFIAQVTALPGIGTWTANYMAMKALRHTDAFPGTDLILKRALELHSKEKIAKMSPWQGYVASLFWREYTQVLKKKKEKNK